MCDRQSGGHSLLFVWLPLLIVYPSGLPLPALSAVDVSEKKLTESPDQVKRFMRGTLEALRYIREQPEPVVDLLGNWLKLDRASARAHFNSLAPALSKDGTMTEKALRAAIDMELERAQIKRDVPLSLVSDSTLITHVQKEMAVK